MTREKKTFCIVKKGVLLTSCSILTILDGNLIGKHLIKI